MNVTGPAIVAVPATRPRVLGAWYGDRHVQAAWDDGTDGASPVAPFAVMSVRRDATPGAVPVVDCVIAAHPSVTDAGKWRLIVASVTATPDAGNVARINRLLSGTGAPALGYYHRTASTVIRVPRHAVSLPATITLEANPSRGCWVVGVSPAVGRSFTYNGDPLAPTASPAPAAIPAPVTPPADDPSLPVVPRLPGLPDPSVITSVSTPTGAVSRFGTGAVRAAITSPALPVTAPLPAPDVVVTPRPAPVLPHDVTIPGHAVIRERPGMYAVRRDDDGKIVWRGNARGLPAAAARITATVPPDPDAPVIVTVKAAPASERDPLGIFTFPTVSRDSAVIVPAATTRQLELAWLQHCKGDRMVIALFGPTGSGKTSLVFDFAARKGIGVCMFDGAGATTFIDWTGATQAIERNGASVTEWHPSAFMQAVRADGRYAGIPRIVMVDEVNRAESAAATNFLLGITHGVGGVYIPDAGFTVPIDPAAMIVYTANIGSAYNATVSLDKALLDRIAKSITVDYPNEHDETKLLADRVPGLADDMRGLLVSAARQTRAIADRGEIEVGISTRRLLRCALDVADSAAIPGMSAMECAEAAWIDSYSGEGGASSQRAIVRSAVQSILMGR